MPKCAPLSLARRRGLGQRAIPSFFIGLFGAAVAAAEVPGFYEVVVNGVAQSGSAYLLFDDVSRPYMALKDFKALGFSTFVPPVWREGLEVAPLSGQAGLAAAIDPNHFVLSLDVDPRWYPSTRTSLNAMQSGKLLPALPGALLNYSFQLSRTSDTALATGSTQNLSLFGPGGLLHVSTAMNTVGTSGPTSAGLLTRRFHRLGTTFFHDHEKHLATLLVGDGVLPVGVGVPSVRFGGITWQSNFGLDPNFSTLETPAMFDAARLPSTLEFFLNDRRVGSPMAIPAGPFEISGLPTVDGAGEAKVLIRDALNNERIVSVPYLQSARLYRQGLQYFSYTAGLLRPDLDHYATPFLASSHRWGQTRWLTLEAGGTLSAASKSLGVGVTFPLDDNVVADARMAMSKSEAGTGQQWGASAQWLVSVASIGVSASHASPNFRLLGDNMSASARLRDDIRLFASRALGHDLGSVSASFGRLSTWGDGTRNLSSLSWFRSFRDFGISLSALRSGNATLLQVGLSIPLSHHGFVSSTLQKNDSATTWRSDYASAPLTGNGLAVRAGMTTAIGSGAEGLSNAVAALDARTDIGKHGVQLNSSARSTSWRVRTAGSLGMLAGHTFFGPPISHGFALVSTGDAPSIPVYRWNLPVAVSDARGLALVTNLSPFRNNLLAIRPEEVPLEYRVTDHEVTAVPRSRGGVFVAFAMRRERPALLTLHLPNGQPVSSGASAWILSTGETAQVGQRGEVYLQNLSEHTELEISFDHQHCRIVVSRPVTTDPQPRLGPFICALSAVP